MTPRIGIIGAGTIGKIHLEAAREAGVSITAIADKNEVLATDVASSGQVRHAFGNARDLINCDDVDAVIVGVPNAEHAPIAMMALEAGKDVLCEKPMAMSVEQCRQMNETAKKHDRLLQIGFVQRFSAPATAAREFIKAGRLGNIYHVKANYYRRRGIPGLGGWFTTKAMSGGGPLIDVGVHAIDIAMHLLDFPKVERISGKVYSNFGKPIDKYKYEFMWAGPPKPEGTFDVEDSAHALIRLEGGTTMELNAAWAGNFPDNSVNNLIGLFGDKGGVTFQLLGDSVHLATEDEGYNADISPKLPKVNSFALQIKAFAESCVSREIGIAGTGEHGQAVQSIIEGIYASSEANKEVDV